MHQHVESSGPREMVPPQEPEPSILECGTLCKRSNDMTTGEVRLDGGLIRTPRSASPRLVSSYKSTYDGNGCARKLDGPGSLEQVLERPEGPCESLRAALEDTGGTDRGADSVMTKRSVERCRMIEKP